MKSVVIHSSGSGAEKFEVVSYGNGTSYSFNFGEAGSPMCNVYLQGDDATIVRDVFESLEREEPDMPTRDLWLAVIDEYL